MKLLKCLSVALLTLGLGITPILAQNDATEPVEENAEPDRVYDCPVGLVCFTPEQVVAMNRRVIDMEMTIATTEAKQSKLGGCVGPGAGYTFEREELDINFDPSVGVYFVWGWRLPW